MTAIEDVDALLPSDEVLANEAYLVARGVRPLALIDRQVPAGETRAIRYRTRLERAAQGSPEAVAFVVVTRAAPGSVIGGYAAHGWVIDLLKWALSPEVPGARSHEILGLLGLLLGYSPQEIADHQERYRGMWDLAGGPAGSGWDTQAPMTEVSP